MGSSGNYKEAHNTPSIDDSLVRVIEYRKSVINDRISGTRIKAGSLVENSGNSKKIFIAVKPLIIL